MKKWFVFGALAMVLVLSSCGNDSGEAGKEGNAAKTVDSPKVVVEKFFAAVAEFDFDKAATYTLPEGKINKDIVKMKEGFKDAPQKDKDMLSKMMKESKIISEKVDGDKATVDYENEGKGKRYFKLELKDGEWKIADEAAHPDEKLAELEPAAETAAEAIKAVDEAAAAIKKAADAAK